MKLSFFRRLFKPLHPEGIPWPGSVLYNRLSSTRIFQWHYEELSSHILRHCKSGRLLDVGTGPGRLLVGLHEKAPDLALVGVDVSSGMVEQARKNITAFGYTGSIDVREANATSLPFPDASFDCVVSSGTMHHWKDATTGLNEVFRVLREGGCALMYDLVSDTPKPAIAEMRRRFGWWRTTLFWLHSFEEPFYSRVHFESLAEETLFGKGSTEFVGLLCCLLLRKPGKQV
ncbi:MAG: class I SAM-dependent methyltransferase [Pseudomonadota bacterium]